MATAKGNHMFARATKPLRLIASLWVVAVLLLGQSVYADSVLWYNGDFDGRDTQVNQTGLGDQLIYDDFVVPVGHTFTITGVFSNDFMYDPSAASTAYWEIRSGVSAGNGGTLLASGDGADSLTATGRFIPIGLNANVYEYTNSVSVNVTLTAGTYWLAVAPDVGNQNSYIGTTSGANAIGTPPGKDGNSFASSSFFGENFVPTSDPSIEGPGTWDYSMGVIGSAMGPSVPEPSSVTLGICALVMSAGYYMKRLRRQS
jgi:hypothetical protein